MAADFATGPSIVSPSKHPQQYGQGVQFTPAHSGAATPANISPASPRTTSQFPHLQHLTRQLRPPKSPLYVPAVLRPTEKPTRSSPPKSGDSNLESVDSGIGSLGRHATGGSIDSGISRIGSDEYLEEARGEVTGEPTRNHWKPDSASTICDASSCQKSFSFFERRHHCRRCGGVFCSEHSSRKVKLNQNALFHPDAAYYRACDRCFALYRQWQHRRDSDTNTESDSQGSNPVGVGPAHIPTTASAADGFKVGSLAQSAPRDWQWSTF